MSNRKVKASASQGREWIDQAMSWCGNQEDRQLSKLMDLAAAKFDAIARIRNAYNGEAVLLLSELIVLLQKFQMRDAETSEEVNPSSPPEDN